MGPTHMSLNSRGTSKNIKNQWQNFFQFNEKYKLRNSSLSVNSQHEKYKRKGKIFKAVAMSYDRK
jgi:hypothetical protein